MLIGIIMYISLFKSEIGSKLRPRSMFQSPLFSYRYGHSFILFVIGCISAEIVGTLNFFLFIQIREIGREKVKCFTPSHSLNVFGISYYLHSSNSICPTCVCVCGCVDAIFNCSQLIVFQSYRQFHASCTPQRQKRKWMKNELIRLDRNLKHRRLLNVKSIQQYPMLFSHQTHSEGKNCIVYYFSTF